MPTLELVKAIGSSVTSMAIAFDQHPAGAMLLEQVALVEVRCRCGRGGLGARAGDEAVPWQP